MKRKLCYIVMFCSLMLPQWHTSSQALPSCPNDSASVQELYFSSDGQKLNMFRIDGTFETWDVRTARLEHLYTFASGQVLDETHSPDGQTILTGNADKSAYLWDTQTGKLLHTLPGDDNLVQVVYAPDGKTVLTHSIRWLNLWDTQTGKLMYSLNVGADAATYSPDSKTVVVDVSNSRDIELWDIETGQILNALKSPTSPSPIRLYMVYSPDGKTVLINSNDDSNAVWDLRTERVVFNAKVDFATAAYAPDSKSLLIASRDGSVKVWDIQSGQLLHTLTDQGQIVERVVYSPNGKIIVTSTGVDFKVWDAQSGQLLYLLVSHIDTINSIDYALDDKAILLSGNGATEMWSVATGKLLHTFHINFGDNFKPLRVTFSPDKTTMAMWGWASNSVPISLHTPNRYNPVLIWNARLGVLLHTLCSS